MFFPAENSWFLEIPYHFIAISPVAVRLIEIVNNMKLLLWIAEGVMQKRLLHRLSFQLIIGDYR
ncbi:hypothetical protein CQW29_16720 [Pantoea coffeiphila]|uniref:Uncharacterized protein n=1 Tax=Pantoea coffeiphila TaxID=1465635 RepID=A0A2S9I8W0_9GAMM|nr:hypothetical protein CQW29_16720 [Pantoea coffeiphila]